MVEASKESQTNHTTARRAETTNSAAISGSPNLINGILKMVTEDQASIEALKREIKEKGDIQEPENKKKAQKMAQDVKNILRIVQDPKLANEVKNLPPVVQIILQSFSRNSVNEVNSPLLYILIESTVNRGYNWNSAADILKITRNIFELRAADPKGAIEILQPLRAKLIEKNYSPDNMKDIVEFLDYKEPTKEERDAKRKEVDDTYEQVYNTLMGFPLGERAIGQIEAGMHASYDMALANKTMTQEAFTTLLKAKIDSDSNNLHVEVKMLFDGIGSARTPDERRINTSKYLAGLTSLRNRGQIDITAYEDLKKLPENLKQYYDQLDSKAYEGRDFISSLRELGTLSLTKRQEALLMSMNDGKSFEDFILKQVDSHTGQLLYVRPQNNSGIDIDWYKFYGDIKGIFEEILSVADSQPKQFHEQAFNPMFEGQTYKLLLKQLAKLGSQLSAMGSPLAKKQIEFMSIASDPNPLQRGAEDEDQLRDSMFRTKYQKDNFASAVSTLLVSRMTNLLEVRAHLHNINAICNLGLGWEQLSQYSDRMGATSLDLYFHEDPELGEAYNFYMNSLEDEVSSNGGVVRTDFGGMSANDNLNSTEWRAVMQLLPVLKQRNASKGLSEVALRRMAIQKIRVAQAIAQGVTGEFWNTLLTARMPLGHKKGSDGLGNDLLQVKEAYTGTASAGYEKMIAEIDMDLLLERFGLPKFFNQFRFVFRPRDLEHPPDPYDKDGRFLGDHGNVYDMAKSAQNAFFRGTTDKQAEYDNKWVCFTDYLRTKNVGLFRRAGWRFVNWQSHIIARGSPLPDGSVDSDGNRIYGAPLPGDPEAYKHINYSETLYELRRVGSYLVKRYIDDLCGAHGAPSYLKIKDMNSKDVELFTGLTGTDGAHLSEAQIKEYFKPQVLYERLIFNQIARVSPSRFLRFERRRYTPDYERLMQDELKDYLKKALKDKGKLYDDVIVEDQVYKMYLTALALAEKSTWWTRRLIKGKDGTDYEFGIAEIDDHKEELVLFFENFKKETGGYRRPSGDSVEILENQEDFLDILKGFTGTLKKSISQNRILQTDKSKTETLQARFARYLAVKDDSAQGDIIHRLGGNDFNMSEFYFSAGGDRLTARMMGETFKCAKEMNPALSEIINIAIPELVKGHYDDMQKFEEAVHKLFDERVKKIHNAISMMDKGQADQFVVSLGIFIAQAMGKDRMYRIKGWGGFAENFVRRMDPTTAASLMQDFFPTTLDHPTTSLDSDQTHAFLNIFLRACNVPHGPEIAERYEDVKFLGKTMWKKRINKGEKWEDTKLLGFIPWKKKVFEGHGSTIEQALKATGLTLGAKWKEVFGPALTWAALLIIFMMIKMALDKNKKK